MEACTPISKEDRGARGIQEAVMVTAMETEGTRNMDISQEKLGTVTRGKR